MALPPFCISVPHALARLNTNTTDTPSHFGVPPCREHRLYLGELDPRPPHRTSSGHFQRIETAPIRVGKVQGLACLDALCRRCGLGVSGVKRSALPQVSDHTPHRL